MRLKSGHTGRFINRSRGGTVLLFLIMALFALFMAAPLLLIISNSLKPLNELWEFPPRLIPRQPTFENYRNLASIMSGSLVPFAMYLANTVFVTAVGTGGHIILASMCAFPLAKKRFPGRQVIFNAIVIALMFSGTVTVISNYMVMAALGWIDSLLSIVVPAFSSTLGLYLMKQFMEQVIPDSLLEAARIDGASQWKIFWRIVMPNVKSGWLTLMLLSVQTLWNSGQSPYILSEEKKTLASALNQIVSGGVARAGVGAAVMVIMMLVPITVFIISQSNIIEAMASSGMKE